jgi:hypothetical protein
VHDEKAHVILVPVGEQASEQLVADGVGITERGCSRVVPG